MLYRSTLKALALLAASSAASAHSWVEQVRRIDSSGAFTGPVGYPIGYVNRTAPNFSDANAQNKILDTKSNPPVCKPKANAYATLDRLSASPGDYVAMLYEENGHVTQPFLTPRPYRDGLVSVYGTLHHEDSDGINDVLNSWTADGKGGNGKGKLLGTHYYDDGQCYQNAGKNFAIPIYATRYKEHGLDELPCQTDFQLPDDLPEEGIYTVMWVWDWPLIVSDTKNVTEIYTSCAEIQLGPRKAGKAAEKIKFSNKNAIGQAAISSQLGNQFEATGLGIGTNSPAAPTGMPTQGSGQDSSSTVTDAPSKSTASASSTTKKHKSKSKIKTVTVTADPQTTTAWQTVTVGLGVGIGGGAGRNATSTTQASSSEMATAIPTSSQSASANCSQPTPTSNVPVTSVSKFLRARATGQVRRVGDGQA
ncbi:hypothetical protein GGS26DRAFT_592767 [Hypomontagnella submonticulosa]|nr:hypothetical protein GGS26DRAFT_592767 [Hypomontagnella submonticulosa]